MKSDPLQFRKEIQQQITNVELLGEKYEQKMQLEASDVTTKFEPTNCGTPAGDEICKEAEVT